MARQKKQSTHKLKIKKGDRVFVVAGSYKDLDRSKEVLEVFPEGEPGDRRWGEHREKTYQAHPGRSGRDQREARFHSRFERNAGRSENG